MQLKYLTLLLKSIAYISILAIASLFHYYLKSRMDSIGPINGNFNIYFYVSTVFMFVVGIVLNFEDIILMIRRKGKYKFDLIRFLIIVCPLIVLSLSMVIYYSNFALIRAFSSLLSYLRVNYLKELFGVVAGMMFVKCFVNVDELPDYSS